MKKSLVLACSALALGLALSSTAEARDGFYLTARGGMTWNNFNSKKLQKKLSQRPFHSEYHQEKKSGHGRRKNHRKRQDSVHDCLKFLRFGHNHDSRCPYTKEKGYHDGQRGGLHGYENRRPVHTTGSYYLFAENPYSANASSASSVPR